MLCEISDLPMHGNDLPISKMGGISGAVEKVSTYHGFIYVITYLGKNDMIV
jgi:hypothetical protein